MTDYVTPRIDDYGTLSELTGDLGLFVAGVHASPTSLSTPAAPGSGVSPAHATGGPAPGPGPGSGVSPAHGTGGPAPGAGPGSGVSPAHGTGGPALGAHAGSPPASAGSATTVPSSAVGHLPFTGFPAAVVAGVGGALTALGAAVRRATRH